MRWQGLPHDQPISELTLPFEAPADPYPPGQEMLSEEERTAFAMTCRCCS
jgi:hypothetical protein